MSGSLDEVELHLITSLDEVLMFFEWLSQRRPLDAIAIDTESSGLDPYSDRVRLIQVGDGMTGWAFSRDDWQGILRDTVHRWTGDFILHNSSFDALFLDLDCGIHIPRHRIHDTMIQARINEPHMSMGLKNQAARHIDAAAAGLQAELKGTAWGWHNVPIDYGPYWQYGALDPVLTYRLHEIHYDQVMRTASKAYEIEMAVLWVCEKMRKYGAYVDRQTAAQRLEQFKQYCQQVEAWTLEEYGVKAGASAAVIEVLEQYGHEFTKATKAGAKALDAEVLGGIEHPLAKAVLGRRQAQKMASTYLRFYVERSDEKSLLHPSFNTVGARTSRMSCNDPNLQNLPRLGTSKFGDVVRNCIASRYIEPEVLGSWSELQFTEADAVKHGSLIMADFDQIEMRILAHFAQERPMIEAFKGSDDFFVTIARQLYEDNTLEKKDKRRQITKNACVPLSTEILTRNGWRKHNEVVIGDETLGLNPTTRQLEWTKINAIHHYNDADVVRFGNRDRSFEVTPNHRWAVEHVSTKNVTLMETHELVQSSRHNVILAAELHDHEGLPITIAEATILGWAFGDGTIKQGTFVGAPGQGKHGQRVKCMVTIGQIKPQWVQEIDDLLRDIPHKRYTAKRRTKSDLSAVSWVLDPEWARNLLQRANLWQVPFDPWKFATSLSHEQRQAVVAALNAAEGDSVEHIKMSQSMDSPIAELMIALGYLSGHFTRVYHRAPDGIGWMKKPGVNVNYQSSFMGPQKTTITHTEHQDVWCVTTELGTWTMRQNDTPVLTGNSYAKIYFAGIRKFAATAGIPPAQAKAFMDRWNQLYPGVQRFSQSVIDTALQRRLESGLAFVRCPLTGRQHVADTGKEYALVNYLIQGAAAAINKMKLVELDNAGLGEYMFATVHDEVLLDVPPEEVIPTVQKLNEIMNDDQLLSVPITAGVSFGAQWGRKRDWVTEV